MFGKIFLLALVCFVGACAKPNYASESHAPDANSGQGNQEERVANCKVVFEKSGACLSWKWEELPTSAKAGTLVFKVYRGNAYDDSPVATDLALVPNLLLWMPSMGHGSTPTTVSRLDVGTYRATNVFFVMPGEWEMRFQVKDGNVIQDEVVVNITL